MSGVFLCVSFEVEGSVPLPGGQGVLLKQDHSCDTEGRARENHGKKLDCGKPCTSFMSFT